MEGKTDASFGFPLNENLPAQAGNQVASLPERRKCNFDGSTHVRLTCSKSGDEVPAQKALTWSGLQIAGNIRARMRQLENLRETRGLMMRRGFMMMLLSTCAWITDMQSVPAVENSAAASQQPMWIWYTDDRQPGQAATFTTSLTIDQPVTSAVLRCAGESAGLVVSLNGQLLAELEPYDPLLRLDVANKLRPGNHRLRKVWARAQ